MPNPFKKVGEKILQALIAALIPILLKMFEEWLQELAGNEEALAKVIKSAVDETVA